MSRMGEVLLRIRRHWKQKGALATARFLLSRVFRHQKHVVYEADCRTPREPSHWADEERLVELGADNLDANLTPELQTFLGGEEAFESLQGVRGGDRLFLVVNGCEYLHRGYILFRTRQSKILGDPRADPLIANCATARGTRGRGLYRRALNAEVCHLQKLGYERVIIETQPDNHASRRGIEAAGFSLAWEAQVWIVLNWLVVQRVQKLGTTRWRCYSF